MIGRKFRRKLVHFLVFNSDMHNAPMYIGQCGEGLVMMKNKGLRQTEDNTAARLLGDYSMTSSGLYSGCFEMRIERITKSFTTVTPKKLIGVKAASDEPANDRATSKSMRGQYKLQSHCRRSPFSQTSDSSAAVAGISYGDPARIRVDASSPNVHGDFISLKRGCYCKNNQTTVGPW